MHKQNRDQIHISTFKEQTAIKGTITTESIERRNTMNSALVWKSFDKLLTRHGITQGEDARSQNIVFCLFC